VSWRRRVLMGDPAHFSVKGGANPHTRTRWGTRRRVDRTRAIEQWDALKRTLEDLGIEVLVVPPDPAQPGLVYPANAGFLTDVDAERPPAEKRFTLSNLLPTRAGEKAHYRRVLEPTGLPLAEFDPRYRFEGEADFFPAGDVHLFTSGRLERQRFVPHLGFPPWKRVYGFRSDARLEPELAALVAPRPVLRIGLVLEAHYHGDTALCAFGPHRQHLLVYRDALAPDDWPVLSARFGDAVIELSGGVSDRLLDQIRERGVTPIVVDVSEFLKKGGGSVKCMIGDLGPVEESPGS